MNIEEKLKEIILERYKNFHNFAIESGLPYTTVRSIFERGFKKSSIMSVYLIAQFLGLNINELMKGNIVKLEKQNMEFTIEEINIIKKYQQLTNINKVRVVSFMDGLLVNNERIDED